MSSTLGASVFAGLSEGFAMTSIGETLALVCANSLGGDPLEGGAFDALRAIARIFLAGTTSGPTFGCGCCTGGAGVAVEHMAGSVSFPSIGGTFRHPRAPMITMDNEAARLLMLQSL
jgi:hypothetical protein